jgi:hypothetical protein
MKIQNRIIPGVCFHGRFSTNAEGIIAVVLRAMRPVLYVLGIGVYYDRYGKQLSFYSYRQDSRCYEGVDGLSYVNIGSGGFVHRRWTNYDYPGQSKYYQRLQGRSGIDFHPIDLRHELPDCPAGSVRLIYMSHTIEHLCFEVAARVIRHGWTLLADGGCFRIVVPDVKRLFEYAKVSTAGTGSDDFLSPAELAKLSYTPSLLAKAADIEHLFSVSDRFEDFAAGLVRLADANGLSAQEYPPDYHLSFWTPESLRAAATAAGYSGFRVTLKNVSDYALFQNQWVFDTTVPEMSLYCDLTK